MGRRPEPSKFSTRSCRHRGGGGKDKKMNALDFLDFILEKHHEGEVPEGEFGEKDPTWDHQRADFIPLCDGCVLACIIDK